MSVPLIIISSLIIKAILSIITIIIINEDIVIIVIRILHIVYDRNAIHHLHIYNIHGGGGGSPVIHNV